jgi:hypothetical protein
MKITNPKFSPRSHSESGSVLLEMLFSVGVLVIIGAGVIDFTVAFQDYGGAVNVARDLVRSGAGYDLDIAEDGAILSACQFVCSRAKTTVCSYGLNPSKYSVNVAQSATYPDMLEVNINRTGIASYVWTYSILPNASAMFMLEGPLMPFNSQGCGQCDISGGCP